MATMVMVSGCIPVKPFSARPASVTVKPRPLGRSISRRPIESTRDTVLRPRCPSTWTRIDAPTPSDRSSFQAGARPKLDRFQFLSSRGPCSVSYYSRTSYSDSAEIENSIRDSIRTTGSGENWERGEGKKDNNDRLRIKRPRILEPPTVTEYLWWYDVGRPFSRRRIPRGKHHRNSICSDLTKTETALEPPEIKYNGSSAWISNSIRLSHTPPLPEEETILAINQRFLSHPIRTLDLVPLCTSVKFAKRKREERRKTDRMVRSNVTDERTWSGRVKWTSLRERRTLRDLSEEKRTDKADRWKIRDRRKKVRFRNGEWHAIGGSSGSGNRSNQPSGYQDSERARMK